VWDVTALKPAEKLVLLYIAADGLDDPVVACRWLNITSNRLWDLVRRLRAKGYVR
jgi:hypothetical protein